MVAGALFLFPASLVAGQGPSTAFSRSLYPAADHALRILSPANPEPVGGVGDIGIVSAAGGLALLSIAINEAPPLDCAPCDRNDVPGFERWVTGTSRDGISDASTLLLGAFGGLSLLDLYLRDDGTGLSHAVASLESASLAYAITLNFKEIVGRRRPFTFSEDAFDLDGFRASEATKSFPSGHSTIAFAMGVSYLKSMGGQASTLAKVVTVASMVGVGVARVASRYHFPSDVLVGAALGSASAWLVHEIKF